MIEYLKKVGYIRFRDHRGDRPDGVRIATAIDKSFKKVF